MLRWKFQMANMTSPDAEILPQTESWLWNPNSTSRLYALACHFEMRNEVHDTISLAGFSHGDKSQPEANHWKLAHSKQGGIRILWPDTDFQTTKFLVFIVSEESKANPAELIQAHTPWFHKGSFCLSRLILSVTEWKSKLRGCPSPASWSGNRMFLSGTQALLPSVVAAHEAFKMIRVLFCF